MYLVRLIATISSRHGPVLKEQFLVLNCNLVIRQGVNLGKAFCTCTSFASKSRLGRLHGRTFEVNQSTSTPQTTPDSCSPSRAQVWTVRTLGVSSSRPFKCSPSIHQPLSHSFVCLSPCHFSIPDSPWAPPALQTPKRQSKFPEKRSRATTPRTAYGSLSTTVSTI